MDQFENSKSRLKIRSYFAAMKLATVCLFSLLETQKSLADSVHMGLRIRYETAMSHVEKKDMRIIETLKRLSEMLPDSKFLIAGHTDSVGSYDVNVELSKARADTVRNLMISSGVDENRIEAKWFSFDAPIASNATEEGRAQNRRIVATMYGLSSAQAKSLAASVEKSKSFYLIKVESESVDAYVEEVLEPKLPPAVEVEEPVVEDVVAEDEEPLDMVEAPVEPKPKVKKEPRNSRYYLGLGVTDNRLTATRNNFEAIWVTDFNSSVSAGYQIEVAKNYWLGVSAVYYLQDYKTTDNPLYSWDEVSPNLFKLGLNFDYEPGHRWTFGLELNYFEETFVTTNGLTVTLEKADFVGLTGRSSFKIYEGRSHRTRLNAEVGYPAQTFATEIDPKGSANFKLGADVSFKNLMPEHEVNIGIYYGVRSFSNFQNDQTENAAGIEFKFRNKKWK